MTSHELWLDPRFSPRFAATRAALLLAAAIPLYLSLANLGHGLIALVLLLAAVWPYRYRVRVHDGSFEVRWLFLRERIPLTCIAGARVEPDPRRWVIGPRDSVLRVRREQRREFLVFGAPSELARVAAALDAPRQPDLPPDSRNR